MSPKSTAPNKSKKKPQKQRGTASGKPTDPDKAPYVRATKRCVCSNLRKASRAVTQMCDRSLSEAASGIRVTQLSLLIEIYIYEPAELSVLSEEMVIDRTTLMRNVKILRNAGLVQSKDSNGHAKQLCLTPKGLAAVNQAIPAWEKTQNQFVKHIGKGRWDEMLKDLSKVIDATRAQ